jgi:hypothetical protein
MGGLQLAIHAFPTEPEIRALLNSQQISIVALKNETVSLRGGIDYVY